jgi:c-di-GMP-binding flagellar brake protein YcgR
MGFLNQIFKARGSRHLVRRPRVSVRVHIEEHAELHRVKDGSSHTIILGDLSAGGARLATPQRMSEGEDLTLTINAGRKQQFEVGCVIVSVRPRHGRLHFDYGVKFVAFHPGELERLREFVTSRGDARKAGALFSRAASFR